MAPTWRGIIPPLVTPLLDQDTLDQDSLARLIHHTIDGGVSGLFLLGSTGEGPSLSYSLRADMIRESCRIAAGRVPVLVCITDSAFTESVRLACLAANAGAAALVAAAPYYFYYSQSDLLEYLDRLTAQLPLPLFLYNMPKLTKVAFDVDTVRAAAGNPKIIGLKDSSGDLDYLRDAIAATRHRPDFTTFIGPEEMLADGMRLGCAGGVCGGGNLNPRLFVSIYEAAQRGDWAEAARLQQQSRDMSAALYTVGDPATSYLRGLKTSLAAAGLCRETLALPLTPFSPAEKAIIESRFAALE
jgi:4-hydroxy-tetrahydrodipicolinate synthase